MPELPVKDTKAMSVLRQKKIAVINDISGYGRCSLTVAIPILSAMRIQCCPIPTAILSNHTEFPVYFFDDYTDKMEEYTDKWNELGLTFDAISTGFLGSGHQIEIVKNIIQKLGSEGTKIFVDPVMGDHGVPYATCTADICGQMKELVSLADVTFPNVTEGCILTETAYKAEGWSRRELCRMAEKIRAMGAKNVVITGIREGNSYTNLVLAEGQDKADFIWVRNAGEERPGTGDVFSSTAAGAILNGKSLKEAVKTASGFVRDCIKKSDELSSPRINGVCFEEILWKLGKK